jgi:hypothetical protein
VSAAFHTLHRELQADPHRLSTGEAAQYLFAAVRQALRHLERGQTGDAQRVLHDAEEATEATVAEYGEGMAELRAEFGDLFAALPCPVTP